MLKQNVKYEDYDGVPKEKTLWFNLTKLELMEHMELADEFRSFHTMLTGPKRQLSIVEVQSILDLIKRLMQLSYGERPDAERFDKSPEVWLHFTQSPAYEAFLLSLFEDIEKAVAFLLGIFPKEVSASVTPDMRARILAGEKVELPDAPELPTTAGTNTFATAEDAVEAAVRDIGNYTEEELRSMPQDEFDALAGKDPQKMAPHVLRIAFDRKTS